jgi:hypothetical protein
MYFLGGFERLSLLHREYAVVMRIAAMPVEALTHEILGDDRLARRPQHYSNLLKQRARSPVECAIGCVREFYFHSRGVRGNCTRVGITLLAFGADVCGLRGQTHFLGASSNALAVSFGR